MKNKRVMVFAILIAFFAFTLSSFGQGTPSKKIEKPHKKPMKIEKSKVPTMIIETFVKEYPVVTEESWYGYPRHDFKNEWYDYNPALSEYKIPEYYIVTFKKDNANHKIIYTKEGKKIAVHKTVTDLPKPILDAIKKGPYSTWKIANEKEKIFRDIEMDKLNVYRLELTNGTEKRHLFYSSNGDLLKDKKIK